MIAHLQYFDAEALGQSEQVVPGAFLEGSYPIRRISPCGLSA
jgi:hypothetical protein